MHSFARDQNRNVIDEERYAKEEVRNRLKTHVAALNKASAPQNLREIVLDGKVTSGIDNFNLQLQSIIEKLNYITPFTRDLATLKALWEERDKEKITIDVGPIIGNYNAVALMMVDLGSDQKTYLQLAQKLSSLSETIKVCLALGGQAFKNLLYIWANTAEPRTRDMNQFLIVNLSKMIAVFNIILRNIESMDIKPITAEKLNREYSNILLNLSKPFDKIFKAFQQTLPSSHFPENAQTKSMILEEQQRLGRPMSDIEKTDFIYDKMGVRYFSFPMDENVLNFLGTKEIIDIINKLPVGQATSQPAMEEQMAPEPEVEIAGEEDVAEEIEQDTMEELNEKIQLAHNILGRIAELIEPLARIPEAQRTDRDNRAIEILKQQYLEVVNQIKELEKEVRSRQMEIAQAPQGQNSAIPLLEGQLAEEEEEEFNIEDLPTLDQVKNMIRGQDKTYIRDKLNQLSSTLVNLRKYIIKFSQKPEEEKSEEQKQKEYELETIVLPRLEEIKSLLKLELEEAPERPPEATAKLEEEEEEEEEGGFNPTEAEYPALKLKLKGRQKSIYDLLKGKFNQLNKEYTNLPEFLKNPEIELKPIKYKKQLGELKPQTPQLQDARKLLKELSQIAKSTEQPTTERGKQQKKYLEEIKKSKGSGIKNEPKTIINKEDYDKIKDKYGKGSFLKLSVDHKPNVEEDRDTELYHTKALKNKILSKLNDSELIKHGFM